MALKYPTAYRTTALNSINTFISLCKLRIYTGSPPANTTDAPTGSLLCEMTLPSVPLNASNGSASKGGTWSGTASASGTAGYFRIVGGSPPGTCYIQGTAGVGGDLNLDGATITNGQVVTITTVSITGGNA